MERGKIGEDPLLHQNSPSSFDTYTFPASLKRHSCNWHVPKIRVEQRPSLWTEQIHNLSQQIEWKLICMERHASIFPAEFGLYSLHIIYASESLTVEARDQMELWINFGIWKFAGSL